MSESDIASELAAGLASAWNQHDMDALARLFHEDAAFVNVLVFYAAREVREIFSADSE
jgi:hypothetical protein